MANTKELRERIKSVKSTQQLTRAMKMVAAAKLKRAQDTIIQLRPYAQKLGEIMGNIAAEVTGDIESPYMKQPAAEKVLLVVVTSNRGLCGAFNANVNKAALEVAQGVYPEQLAAGNLSILAIGKKAFEYFKKRGFNMVGENHDVFADLSFDSVNAVATMVMDGFVSGKWDRVDLVYNEFKNVMSQIKRHEQFLPIAANPAPAPAAGAAAKVDYIFEPNKVDILTDLIPKSLRIRFYKAVLESNAGEQGARMVAMDNATTNAEELIKQLRLAYNQARQAAITKEILEIVAGAEALASAG
ncbi:MAG: ATP synthase F1 subunit gamma [Bacteroidia bacterium]